MDRRLKQWEVEGEGERMGECGESGEGQSWGVRGRKRGRGK